jgi:hypothetical protein
MGLAGFRDDPRNPGAHRKTDLINYAHEHGKQPTDFYTQLNFMWHEMKADKNDPGSGKESAALDAILSTHTPESAAVSFSNNYERPRKQDANNENRKHEANLAFNKFAPGYRDQVAENDAKSNPSTDSSSEFGHLLAAKAEEVARRMHSTMQCAAGPRQVFEAGGFNLPRVVATEQGEIIANHPEWFRELKPGEAHRPGDYGVRHWSDLAIRQDSHKHEGAPGVDRGDSFILRQVRVDGREEGANDHLFTVPDNGTHYTGPIKYYRATRAFEQHYLAHYSQQADSRSNH